MSRSCPALVAAAAGCLVLFAGCATGPASRQDVCREYDELGKWYLNANGLIDNMVFHSADDLADTAKRYTGSENLTPDIHLLAEIADSTHVNGLELANATTHIADLCGYPIGLSALSGSGRSGDTNGGASSQTPRPYTPPPAPTTEDTPVPAGYRRVQGPAGITVEIPATFQVTASPAVANSQAAEPGNPDLFLRFGGSAAPKSTLLAEIQAGERTNPNVQNGYRRLRLTTVSFRGTTAVDWEFTFVKDGQTRHAYGRYWRVGTTGYVVYASAPAPRWSEIRPAFDHMLETAATP